VHVALVAPSDATFAFCKEEFSHVLSCFLQISCVQLSAELSPSLRGFFWKLLQHPQLRTGAFPKPPKRSTLRALSPQEDPVASLRVAVRHPTAVLVRLSAVGVADAPHQV
jgi:hypothetical protein